MSVKTIFSRADVSKYLRALRTSQQPRYTQLKNRYGYHLNKMKIDLNKKNLSEKEQKIINEKIRRKIINERRRVYSFATIITISLIIIVYFIIKKLF